MKRRAGHPLEGRIAGAGVGTTRRAELTALTPSPTSVRPSSRRSPREQLPLADDRQCHDVGEQHQRDAHGRRPEHASEAGRCARDTGLQHRGEGGAVVRTRRCTPGCREESDQQPEAAKNGPSRSPRE